MCRVCRRVWGTHIFCAESSEHTAVTRMSARVNPFLILLLLPACSAIRMNKLRVFMPTQQDVHCTHLNLYTTDESMPVASFSLNLKNEPMVNEFVSIIIYNEYTHLYIYI